MILFVFRPAPQIVESRRSPLTHTPPRSEGRGDPDSKRRKFRVPSKDPVTFANFLTTSYYFVYMIYGLSCFTDEKGVLKKSGRKLQVLEETPRKLIKTNDYGKRRWGQGKVKIKGRSESSTESRNSLSRGRGVDTGVGGLWVRRPRLRPPQREPKHFLPHRPLSNRLQSRITSRLDPCTLSPDSWKDRVSVLSVSRKEIEGPVSYRIVTGPGVRGPEERLPRLPRTQERKGYPNYQQYSESDLQGVTSPNS